VVANENYNEKQNISQHRLCDITSDCPGQYKEDEGKQCLTDHVLSSCEKWWTTGAMAKLFGFERIHELHDREILVVM
jgi:hypothetical protein